MNEQMVLNLMELETYCLICHEEFTGEEFTHDPSKVYQSDFNSNLCRSCYNKVGPFLSSQIVNRILEGYCKGLCPNGCEKCPADIKPVNIGEERRKLREHRLKVIRDKLGDNAITLT